MRGTVAKRLAKQAREIPMIKPTTYKVGNAKSVIVRSKYGEQYRYNSFTVYCEGFRNVYKKLKTEYKRKRNANA